VVRARFSWKPAPASSHHTPMSGRRITFSPVLNLLVLAMLCVLAVQAKSLAATNLALTPVSDTFISTHFTTPNGGTPDMVIGTQGVMASSAQNRGLLKFDLSS